LRTLFDADMEGYHDPQDMPPFGHCQLTGTNRSLCFGTLSLLQAALPVAAAQQGEQQGKQQGEQQRGPREDGHAAKLDIYPTLLPPQRAQPAQRPPCTGAGEALTSVHCTERAIARERTRIMFCNTCHLSFCTVHLLGARTYLDTP
jgi:hypothetical protein